MSLGYVASSPFAYSYTPASCFATKFAAAYDICSSSIPPFGQSGFSCSSIIDVGSGNISFGLYGLNAFSIVYSPCTISDASASSSSGDAVVTALMVIGVFFAFFFGFSSGKGFVK
jgi:hypothetical protein